MKILYSSIILLLLISSVSGDIISVGATGDDQVVVGKGNEVDTFFSGTQSVAQIPTGGNIPTQELLGIPLTPQNITICIISFIALIIFIIILILIYLYEKKKRKS